MLILFFFTAVYKSFWRLDKAPRLFSLLTQWKGLTDQNRAAVTSRSHSVEGRWTVWIGKKPSTSLSTTSVMRIIVS